MKATPVYCPHSVLETQFGRSNRRHKRALPATALLDKAD